MDTEPTGIEPKEIYTDALELAFDKVKEFEAHLKRPSNQPNTFLETHSLAALWVNLAIGVELRKLTMAVQAMRHAD
jgi:hypothetical protein